RWLREVIAPADSIRSTAIIAHRKPLAQEIIRRCFLQVGHRLSADERDDLFTPVSHSQVNLLRSHTFHYGLILDADLFHARHSGATFDSLLQAITPIFCRAPGSALIFVGDSAPHPRSGFVRMARRQPYPLPVPNSARPQFIHSTGATPCLDNPWIIPWIPPDINPPPEIPNSSLLIPHSLALSA
ncbi:MAG: hypothetical protein NC484_05815, partial [Alloprevotella sp.]|nr:hypothetical protein [Alloprevotella sp.]